MELSPRLRIIADSIKECDTLADIGSDHAYLPIFLVKNHKIKKAVASDINQGPVEIAQNRVRQHRAEASIEVRKGSGLRPLEQGEADTIVIAGMGGLLIKDILQEEIDKARSATLLILQPMRDSDRLRRWLYENGFDILDEELVKDEGKIYEIIWAAPGQAEYDKEDLLLIGRKIIEKRHPLALEYIDKKLRELEKIASMISDKESRSCRERLAECSKIQNYYRELRKWVQ